MVFSPPDAADVWQHNKKIENSAMRPSTSKKLPPATKGATTAETRPDSSSNPEPERNSERKPPAINTNTTTTETHPLSSNPVVKRSPTTMSTSNVAAGAADEEAAPAPPPKNKIKKNNPLKQNVSAERAAKDGQDRSHIPPMSMMLLRLHLVQLVLAVVYLVLASFAAFTLNMGNLAGFGLSFFIFSWTVTYFVWLGLSIYLYPILYHWIPHVAVEALTAIFWLAAWASLASYASALNLAGAGRAVGLARRKSAAAGGPGEAKIGEGHGGRSPAAVASAGNSAATVQAAEISIGVDAGLGAVIWVLFVVTLVMTVLAVLRQRRKTSGKEPAVV